MSIRNRLKEVRLEKGLTQESLASLVGVTRQTVIAVEKSKFVPSVKLALELARALGTPLADIFWLDPSEGAS
ncbi:MAG: helix-turn-helix transcriptional regulator [Anaerolineales bacterium]|jgi:putative transcriptional regulator